MFLHHPLVKISISGSLRDREVACSASDPQGSNFESCVWRVVSSHSSHHPQEVADSFYFYKTQLLPCFSALTTTHVRGCVELDTSAKILPSMSISTQHLQYIVINSTSPQDTAIYVHINTAPPIYCYQFHITTTRYCHLCPYQHSTSNILLSILHHHTKILPSMSISTQHLQYIVINVYITTTRYCHLCPYQHSTSDILLSIPHHHTKILSSVTIWLVSHNILLLWTTECQIPYIIWA